APTGEVPPELLERLLAAAADIETDIMPEAADPADPADLRGRNTDKLAAPGTGADADHHGPDHARRRHGGVARRGHQRALGARRRTRPRSRRRRFHEAVDHPESSCPRRRPGPGSPGGPLGGPANTPPAAATAPQSLTVALRTTRRVVTTTAKLGYPRMAASVTCRR